MQEVVWDTGEVEAAGHVHGNTLVTWALLGVLSAWHVRTLGRLEHGLQLGLAWGRRKEKANGCWAFLRWAWLLIRPEKWALKLGPWAHQKIIPKIK